MRAELSWKQRLIRWAISAVLLLAGVGFAFVGPQVLGGLGLPVWSDGDHDWNYVGITAFVIFTAGISVLNSTLLEKVRFWIWLAVIGVTLVLTCG